MLLKNSLCFNWRILPLSRSSKSYFFLFLYFSKFIIIYFLIYYFIFKVLKFSWSFRLFFCFNYEYHSLIFLFILTIFGNFAIYYLICLFDLGDCLLNQHFSIISTFINVQDCFKNDCYKIRYLNRMNNENYNLKFRYFYCII
jgi:hypothetical protein